MPALRPQDCCSAATCRPFDAVDRREPDPAELRARALEAETAALAVRGRHQLERRRRKRIRRRPSRLRRRAGFPAPIASPATAASAARDRGRGRDHAARPCLAQRAPSRRPRHRRGDRPQGRGARGRTAQPHAARSPANIRCSSIRASPASLLGHFVGRDFRLVDRSEDELPSGQARRTHLCRRRDDRRRSAAPARPALAPVRRRRRARCRGRSWCRTACSTAGSRRARRRGSSGSNLPAMPRAVSAERRCEPEQPLHGSGRAQPRGAARCLSRGCAGHRTDWAGREWRDGRL